MEEKIILSETIEEAVKTKEVRINGVIFNIVFLFVGVILIALTIFIKLNLLNEEHGINNFTELNQALFKFTILLFIGLFLHTIIRVIILMIYKAKGIRLKSKDFVVFVYTKSELTIKQAKIVWIAPFVLVIIAYLIAIFLFDVVIASATSLILVGTTDDLIMYYHLRKFKTDEIYVQKDDCLGFNCIIKE